MNDEVHIGKIIGKFSNEISRKIGKEVGQYDISSIQGKILGFVYRESFKKDIFQKHIEEEFNIRRSSVTSVLQLMEKKEYIKRVSVEEDARLKKIVLTEKGISIERKIHDCIIEIETSLQDELSEDEMDTLVNLLNRLYKKIAE